jgi:hypothetical protein
MNYEGETAARRVERLSREALPQRVPILPAEPAPVSAVPVVRPCSCCLKYPLIESRGVLLCKVCDGAMEWRPRR